MGEKYDGFTQEQIDEMKKFEEKMKELKEKMKKTKENFITVNKEKKKEDALNLIQYIEETTGCKYDKEVDARLRRLIAENKNVFMQIKQIQEVKNTESVEKTDNVEEEDV